MSMQPGGFPDFDFDSTMFRSYDHVELAQRVVWPMVDTLWRGDWRENSWPNDDLSVCRHGSYGGTNYGAQIGAYTETEDVADTDKNNPIISTAFLEVQEILDQQARLGILELAESELDEMREASSTFDKSQLIAKSCVAYKFDTDDDLEISSSTVLESPGGNVIWFEDTQSKDTDEHHDYYGLETPLYAQDLERIEAGLYVLKTPRAIMKTLQKIKECRLA